MSRGRGRRRALAVGLALAAVLAGCSGVAGPGADPGGTATLTPAPVATDAGAAVATPTPGALAPGLGPDRVRDPFRLATTHRAELRNESYRRVRVERITGANGTLWNATTRTRLNADRSRVLFAKRVESAPAYPVDVYRKDLRIYYDGEISYFRGFVRGNLSYAKVPGGAGSVFEDVPARDRLLILYGSVDLRVRETADGYRLAGTAPSGPEGLDRPPLIDAPRNVTVVVRLTRAGRVRSYRVTYEARFRGRPVRVVRRTRFAGVGTTTVPEPDWYAAAVNATGG